MLCYYIHITYNGYIAMSTTSISWELNFHRIFETENKRKLILTCELLRQLKNKCENNEKKKKKYKN